MFAITVTGLRLILALGAVSLLSCGKRVQPAGDDQESTVDRLTALVNKLPDSCDASTLLARLIVMETEERTLLDARVRALQATQEDMTRQQAELREALKNLQTTRQHQKDQIIAFSAHVSSHLSGLSRTQTIVFGTVVTNLGTAYSAQTGVFRCPVAGVYQFYVSILSRGGDRIETKMVVNGHAKLHLFSSGGPDGYNGSLGTGTVILELRAGDEVWVQNFIGTYVHCCWSSFSGCLLRSD